MNGSLPAELKFRENTALYTVPNKGQGYIYCYRDVFYELVREWEDCNSVAGWNIEEHMGDRIRCSNSIMI